MMENISYWRKQNSDNPLFPDLIWSRPEQKSMAGKLLIVGGNKSNFRPPSEAYEHAIKTGIGIVHVLLPDALKNTLGKLLPEAYFAPSTPSGSFSRKALAELLVSAQWADGVLLAGGLGRNSETTILIEGFARKYDGQLTFVGDAVDTLIGAPESLLPRKNTTLILSFEQLQKCITALHSKKPLTSSMNLFRFIKILRDLSMNQLLADTVLIVEQFEQIHCVLKGQVISTQVITSSIETATKAAVWWLQNPSKSLESISSSLIHNPKV